MDSECFTRNLDLNLLIQQEYNILPLHCGETWESIVLPEGYEKPTKEVFEAKLQEYLANKPWKKLREERNKRLAESDWVTLRAQSTGTDVPEEWKIYLQALRDLPANTVDPENPVWPTPPS